MAEEDGGSSEGGPCASRGAVTARASRDPCPTLEVGKWWVFIDYNGKRKAKCVGDKRTAKVVAQKIEAKLALGDFGVMEEKERRPFDVYFRDWLETYVRANCKPSTYACYETAFR